MDLQKKIVIKQVSNLFAFASNETTNERITTRKTEHKAQQ